MATSLNYQMEVEGSEFNCPLCLEIFDEPKSFPTCVHTLCKACLVKLVSKKEGNDVLCPVCRQASPLPSRGVDGFPTNTFIVRLMEKIPGIKEKREIMQSIARCKNEIERKKKVMDNMEKQLDRFKKNKELAEEMKKQISSHAKEYAEAIKQCGEKMCQDIDEYVKQTCDAQLQRDLAKEAERLASYLEVSQNCVLNVEDIIIQDDLSGLPAMKDLIKEQLKEFSRYPASFLEEVENVKPFEMVFEKSEIKADVLGKAFCKETKAQEKPAASVSRHSSSNFHSNSVCSESLIRRHLYEELEDSSDESMESTVLHSVNLQFCPTRIAVSENSIALLCKERRKVFLYDGDAEIKGTVQIKYGNLTDVGFFSGEVVVVNRENNRLLFYNTNGIFLPRKFQNPPQNVKFTYLSVDEANRVTVVSTLTNERSDDDDVDDDDYIDVEEINKCVVLYESSGAISKIVGRHHLEHPVSRAIFYPDNSKLFVADLINGAQEIAVKTFTSDFTIAEIVVTENVVYNTLFVSLYLEKSEGFRHYSNKLLIGCSGKDFLFVIDESGQYTERRSTCPAKQQESLIGIRDFYIVEIYPDKNLFKIVTYD